MATEHRKQEEGVRIEVDLDKKRADIIRKHRIDPVKEYLNAHLRNAGTGDAYIYGGPTSRSNY